MGNVANISDFASSQRGNPSSLPSNCEEGFETGRLIPGMESDSSWGKRSKSATWRTGFVPQSGIGVQSPRWEDKSILPQLFPCFIRRFDPRRLGTAGLDLTLIWLAFVVQSRLLGSAVAISTLTTTTFCFYWLIFALFAVADGLYGKSRRSIFGECVLVARVIIWAALLTSFALKCSPVRPGLFPVFLLSWTSLVAMVLVRKYWTMTPVAECNRRNVLLVGTGELAQLVAGTLRQNSSLDRSLKGLIPDADFRGVEGPAMLSEIARKQFIDEVIIASYDPHVCASVIREAQRNRIDVKVVPEFLSAESKVVAIDTFAGVPLLSLCEQRVPEWALAVKRALDFLMALVSLVALSPLLVLIGLIVKLSSSGPVLYRASRVGLKGRQFWCFKFRTMIIEADALKSALRVRNERAGAFFKISNDPRITPIGRILRRYSLDELPQLWSVLLGDMSLVGPRPHPLDDVRHYSLQHLQRLDFVPGMTGLWQVTARRDPSFERSVALDVKYIKNWSLSLDLKILWQTIPALICGSGE
jgi:exopolysaccharide biosynthesis polyprenyl glycosylphosphotransferase